MASESIRFVAKLIQESVQSQDPSSSKELKTTMMVVNKENNSADLNSAKNPSDKDLSINESDSTIIPGFTSNNHNKSSSQSPPLPARINLPASTLTPLPVIHSSSKASPSTSTMSSPASSVCSPGFGSKSPPISIASGNDFAENRLSSRGSAFNLTSSSSLVSGGQRDGGTHLLSQHLLELNQMRPLSHQSQSSPPYKFFQDNAFYQSRPLLNGNDLSDFKLNVQMKEKQTLREAFATTTSETSEEVVVDGNDDTAEDSQQNTVSD